MTPLLKLSGVTKRFGGLTAVDGVDLRVMGGEIVGIVGPNGSGKTTIFSCVSGFHRPEQGHVEFDGRNITGLKPFEIARRGIARTFQIVQPFEELSILENVVMGALSAGPDGRTPALAEARDSARRIVEFSGLAAEADRLAGNLGIPGRKRLEVARALAMRPKLLLLDEVMAGLRPVEVDEAVALVKRIRDQGITIVVVEHLMRAVTALAERLYVIHHGSIIAEGDDPREVLRRNAVVEAYFGRAALGA
jgi:branched-chain amino acid transport system ATP-binding protein